MTPLFRAPRDRILELLEAALDQDALDAAYGDVPAPKVSIGGLPSEPPYEVIVRELPASASFERISTCPMAQATWTVQVDLVATNADLVRATNAVLAYADALVQVTGADRTLGGSVITATPELSYVGTSATGKGTYLAAMAAGVRCVADPKKNTAIWEAIGR